MSVEAIKRRMIPATKPAGIEGLRFDDLRHKAISRFFEGTDLTDIEIASITGSILDGNQHTEAAIAQVEADAERADRILRRERAAKRRAARGKLPAHLPRIEADPAPEMTTCPHCQAAMVVIDEDRSERLDIIPAQFRVVVTRRPKLACRACSGVWCSRRHRRG